MPGNAGYWHYHDHAMGTDHGTAGLARGLYGGLIVRKRGDLLPSRQYTVVFNEMMINHEMAPDTPILEARLGERVEWVCVGYGSLPHTFHLHAHRWADTRTGMLGSASDNAQTVDNKNLDPGSSFGFQVIAGEGVGPGVGCTTATSRPTPTAGWWACSWSATPTAASPTGRRTRSTGSRRTATPGTT